MHDQACGILASFPILDRWLSASSACIVISTRNVGAQVVVLGHRSSTNTKVTATTITPTNGALLLRNIRNASNHSIFIFPLSYSKTDILPARWMQVDTQHPCWNRRSLAVRNAPNHVRHAMNFFVYAGGAFAQC